MAIPTLALIPDSSGFSANVGDGVLSVKLNGGASRYRRSYIGSTYSVSCSWILNRDQYNYIKAFFRTACNEGSTPFYVKMIFEDDVLKPYKAYWKPQTFSLSSIEAGEVFTVSAELEVYPNTNADKDDAIILAFEGKLSESEDELNTITNYDLPNHFHH